MKHLPFLFPVCFLQTRTVPLSFFVLVKDRRCQYNHLVSVFFVAIRNRRLSQDYGAQGQNTMRLGTALVLSAPSGAGKTTLVKKLLKEFPNFGFSISCTTRMPRPNEVDGKDYHFLTKQQFEERRARGHFAEWAKVHDNFYGTPLGPLHTLFEHGRDVLLDVDVQGAAQLRNTLPHASFVFILPPSMKELERRLRSRGTDSEEDITKRLHNACEEIACARWFDACLLNDRLDKAYDELRSLYLAATCKTALNRPLIDHILLEEKLPLHS